VTFLLVSERIVSIEEFFMVVPNTANLSFATGVGIPESPYSFFVRRVSPCLFKLTNYNVMYKFWQDPDYLASKTGFSQNRQASWAKGKKQSRFRA